VVPYPRVQLRGGELRSLRTQYFLSLLPTQDRASQLLTRFELVSVLNDHIPGPKSLGKPWVYGLRDPLHEGELLVNQPVQLRPRLIPCEALHETVLNLNRLTTYIEVFLDLFQRSVVIH
jgi:hypothetical protein